MSSPQTTILAVLVALWKPDKADEMMRQAFAGHEGELFWKLMSSGETLLIDQRPGTIYLEIYSADMLSSWTVDICTGTFTQIMGTEPIVRFQVPEVYEDAFPAFVEFLHENPMKWDGDESGIILYNSLGDVIGTALPGDYIVRNCGGIYCVEKKQ